MWGEAPITHADIYEVFAQYVEGKIPILPWCESALNQETLPLTLRLAAVNRAGFLTINSQPAVNGEKSTHPLYGWGGVDGRVYQKAYVEFFASPDMLKAIMEVVSRHSNLNYFAINHEKTEFSAGIKSVTGKTAVQAYAHFVPIASFSHMYICRICCLLLLFLYSVQR
jgi:methylenetetrahydrofolate reductase (NADPH)